MVKLLHEVGENTRTETQQTLDIKMNRPNQNFKFEQTILFPEKRMIGVTNLQVDKNV